MKTALRAEIDPPVVEDEEGRALSLSSLWQQGATVLVFVRHFGCMFCAQQVSELATWAKELAEQRGRLVVIGNGTPNFIEGFRKTSGFEGAIYVDPKADAYDYFEFARSVRSNLGIPTVKAAIKAWRNGYRQGKTAGNPWQQGGVVIVDGGGTPRYVYRSRFAGDHPSLNTLKAEWRKVLKV